MQTAWTRIALFATLTLASESAFARDAGAEEIASLEREIAADHATLMRLPRGHRDGALSADACTTACQALRSMRRATDRLCGIEPGPSCDDARRRTAEAEVHVTDACPTCVTATDRGEAVNRPEAVSKDQATAEPAPGATPVQTESAPRRGGCAGCTTTRTSPPSPAFIATALALGFAALRRRRR